MIRLLALCGFRCSGKSHVRSILATEHGLTIFDTDAVETGDSDADRISVEEVIARYGKGESYFHFLVPTLQQTIAEAVDILVIDSVKAAADQQVLRQYFPSASLRLLWIHAPFALRQQRYIVRDVNTARREESLENHDAGLIRLGLWRLATDSDYVVCNVFKEDALRADISRIIGHYRAS